MLSSHAPSARALLSLVLRLIIAMGMDVLNHIAPIGTPVNVDTAEGQALLARSHPGDATATAKSA